ncbi:MAG: carbohydrate ABC transporter permease [Motilibacteraceae bacterium]
MSTAEKFGQMFLAIAIFAVVFVGILVIAGRVRGRSADSVQAASFVGPSLLLLAVGLIYPALRTLLESFKDAQGKSFVGFDNYTHIFTSGDLQIVLRNTILWVLVVPFLSTAIGLLYAVLVDRVRGEAVAKALVFLPMAISFVGASIIWKFVYDFRPAGRPQIGLLNEILTKLGIDPFNFILEAPWNTFFLMIVMIWIQAGFAMTVLSAAIKAIPDDIVEAARLDGVGGIKLFRYVTLPTIRPAVVVVLTTIGIATLKVFDIVRTITGGQFNTSVVANEFYNQSFRYNNSGLGAALAVLLFILVVPIVVYNVRQLRKADAR